MGWESLKLLLESNFQLEHWTALTHKLDTFKTSVGVTIEMFMKIDSSKNTYLHKLYLKSALGTKKFFVCIGWNKKQFDFESWVF